MQVPDKDVANHVVPESCVVHREVQREALTGESIGQPLSRDRFFSFGCRHCHFGGRKRRRARHRECSSDPAWSKTLACAHAPFTGTGRSRV